MKRTLFVTIMLLTIGMMVYAQQQAGGSSLPTTADTKQSAQQVLSQAKTNSSQFETILASLREQNTSNGDADAYRKLKLNIDQLELRIKKEQTQIQALLDKGQKVSPTMIDDIQRLIDQHKAAMTEMENFIAAK
jgi:predicted  nucleic acid-binding Zn-ribbon protein